MCIVDAIIDIATQAYIGNMADSANGAVFYYSPGCQATMHKKYPAVYKAMPGWANDKTERVYVPGAGTFSNETLNAATRIVAYGMDVYNPDEFTDFQNAVSDLILD